MCNLLTYGRSLIGLIEAGLVKLPGSAEGTLQHRRRGMQTAPIFARTDLCCSWSSLGKTLELTWPLLQRRCHRRLLIGGDAQIAQHCEQREFPHAFADAGSFLLLDVPRWPPDPCRFKVHYDLALSTID